MEKTFKLTQRDDKKLNRVRLSGLFLWILCIIGAFLTDGYEWKVNPFAILIIIILLIVVIAPVFFPRFKFIGELVVGSERIQIKEHGKETVSYQTDSIDNVKVNFRGTKGDNFMSGMVGVAGLAHKDGAGNKLIFEHSGENLEFEFFSSEQMDFKAIKRIFIELDKKGIKVSLKRTDS
jgi:hypothetical protein